MWTEGASWILEADIQSFFDSVCRKTLMEMLRERIADEPFLRLVGKCLHVGVLDGVELTTPEVGTAQGSILSPILGNIYLHHVLDLWFEREVKRRLKGRARLIRYADDFVIAFERRDDAERVMGPSSDSECRGSASHCIRTRHAWCPSTRLTAGRKGNRKRRRSISWASPCSGGGATREVGRYGSRHALRACDGRSRPSTSSAAAGGTNPSSSSTRGLCRRLEGHMNYFGVSGNTESLSSLVYWGGEKLEEVAEPTEPAGADELGAIQLCVAPLPAPTPHHPCAVLGAGEVRRPQRRSRMVEISSSGSGEGPGEREPPGLLDRSAPGIARPRPVRNPRTSSVHVHEHVSRARLTVSRARARARARGRARRRSVHV